MMGAILVGIWLVKKTIAGTITVSEFYLLITAIITLATDLLALSDQIASNSKSRVLMCGIDILLCLWAVYLFFFYFVCPAKLDHTCR